jgi:radical SAM superfamily enzyme YgiQ (UPF0313 family)
MSNARKLVYFTDLTHTGPVISSEVFPYGVGMVAASLVTSQPGDWDVEIFKHPSDLNNALKKRIPDVIASTNYSWNLNLTYAFFKQIKSKYPEVLTVMGGPNYGLHEEEVQDFWKRYHCVDIYVVGEGEQAFSKLLSKFHKIGSIEMLKDECFADPGLHFTKKRGGNVIQNEPGPRLNLDDLPSPYLLGLFDKFWDTSLIPLTATTRGCPFHCTMCAEGSDYYNKVEHNNKFREEISYIARNIKKTEILYLSDANFGMFKQDIEKAKIISEIQQKFGYPKSIISATGKNRKENVIEVASMLNGALAVFASLQSTDSKVLQFIKRDNIKTDSLKGISDRLGDGMGGTVTELILSLPGDSKETHIQSLRDTVNAGLGVIRNYQLIMLKQSELNTPASRITYQMKTKFRLMPRSFGRYEIMGDQQIACEPEEICVQNSTMLESEQQECREIDLTVEIMHNGGPYSPYWVIINSIGYSWFDFILRVHHRRAEKDSPLKKLYQEFLSSMNADYFDTEEALHSYVNNNIEELSAKTDGTNEMSRGKARAFFEASDELSNLIHEELVKLITEKKLEDRFPAIFIDELRLFSKLQRQNILDTSVSYTQNFNYDFEKFQNFKTLDSHSIIKMEMMQEFKFIFTSKQKALISGYKKLYGCESIDALGRFLMRSRLTDMLRLAVRADLASDFESGSTFETGLESFFSYN